MSKTHHDEHVEHHFTASDLIRDIVIGMSDGLTVPFALAAGLSGSVASTGLILTAGTAEIAAGAIAMGLGGYLAARTEAEHYETELKREYYEIEALPEREEEEVAEIFREYELEEDQIQSIITTLKKKPDKWVDLMMRFELGLEKPDPSRARNSAITIALSYILGGLVPLLPYFFISHPISGLEVSAVITLIALAVFGYVKGKFTGTAPWKSSFQTAVVGGLAAGAAFILARLIS